MDDEQIRRVILEAFRQGVRRILVDEYDPQYQSTTNLSEHELVEAFGNGIVTPHQCANVVEDEIMRILDPGDEKARTDALARTLAMARHSEHLAAKSTNTINARSMQGMAERLYEEARALGWEGDAE